MPKAGTFVKETGGGFKGSRSSDGLRTVAVFLGPDGTLLRGTIGNFRPKS